MIDYLWAGIAVHCQPKNTASFGFLEGKNNDIHLIQRQPYAIGAKSMRIHERPKN